MKIFINPGHYPRTDPGACGFGMSEADKVLAIGKKVEKILQTSGITTKLVQMDSLAGICNASNSWGADLFVSIHCNAANTVAKGTETYCYRGATKGRQLASAIHAQIKKHLTQLTDRGVKEAGYYVIANTDCPACLVETAFIDNASDNKILAEQEDTFAQTIAKGILDYAGISYSTTQPTQSIYSPTKKVNPNTPVEIITSLSAKYESNGDPACVANNAGDLSGISYGKYQFASNVGTVKPFIDWLCNYPDSALANYGKVLADKNINSPQFIEQWKQLGTIDPGNFGRLQDEYVVKVYYGGVSEKLHKENFNVEKHSDALKAVIFSRAVQNGITGCKNLFLIAVSKLGQPNLSYVDAPEFDRAMINAIYDFLITECNLAKPDSQGIWRSPDNFCHGSKQIIDSLRNRFVHERTDALAML